MKKEGNILVEKIIAPIVVAILVGGTVPWWWEKVFSGIKPVASLSCPENFTCDGGHKRPLPGYTRVESGKDEVQWTPGSTHPDHNHIVASKTEGFWKPELGYWWSCGSDDRYRDGSSNLEVVESPEENSLSRLFRRHPCPSGNS